MSTADERIEVVGSGGDVILFTPVRPGDRSSATVAGIATAVAAHRVDQAAPPRGLVEGGVGSGVPRSRGGGVVWQKDRDARTVAFVVRAGQGHGIDRVLDGHGGLAECGGCVVTVGNRTNKTAQVAEEGNVVGDRVIAGVTEHVDVITVAGQSHVDEVTQGLQQQAVTVGGNGAVCVPAPEIALVLVLVAVDKSGGQGLGPNCLGILLEHFKECRVVVPIGTDDFL